ncbi:MAG: hypothetical protein IT561_12540 [Alphaproteobacteria bacterium]|nr:hypothetical protein [Alphaproteobacteria bacterium]
MSEALVVADGDRVHAITLADMEKYHGRNFFNGLAQAFQVMRAATERLGGGRPLDRRRVRLVLGLDPPGVLDGFEYLTRAFTDRRVVVDRRIGIGPESYDGFYYFEVQYEGRRIVMVLGDDVLPEGYTLLARRGFAGLLTADERARWNAGKQAIADRVLAGRPEDSFTIEGPLPA